MWLLPISVLSQGFQLQFEGTKPDLDEIGRYHVSKEYDDSLVMIDRLVALRQTSQEQGFLNTRFDTAWVAPGQLKVRVSLGTRYQWLHLGPGNVDPVLLHKLGFKERFYTNKPFHYRDAARLMNKLVELSVDSGYPFALVRLDSVSIEHARVDAKLFYDTGPHITFDSIKIAGSVKVKPKFLHTYLGITPGDPFSESSLQNVPNRLKKLPYLKLKEAPYLSFQNDQATTYLDLEDRRANQIDGILGFLPNAGGDGGLLLTGQFNLSLENMFGSGRRFGLQWESFKRASQLLNINFYQPLILSSPINIDLGFQLLKEDSTFVNRSVNIDVSYAFKAFSRIKVFSHLKSTRLSTSTFLEEATSLPNLADFDINQYGLGYEWSNLDDYLYPKNGTLVEGSLSAGLKKLRKNSLLNDSLYQDVDFENNQISWEVQAVRYWRVGKRWVVASKLKGGGLSNDRLFFNDLFRLGGFKSLRGFSENSFFAQYFVYSTVEPRFFFDTNSYLFLFYDQAWWLHYNLVNDTFDDQPSGFGAGISLTTEAGIFNFIWALGRSKQQDIGASQSKIHFGYISKF